MENLYLYIFIFVGLYYSIKIIKKYLQYNFELKQIQFKFENREKEIEEKKPQKFTSLLKNRKSRIDEILACKNS